MRIELCVNFTMWALVLVWTPGAAILEAIARGCHFGSHCGQEEKLVIRGPNTSGSTRQTLSLEVMKQINLPEIIEVY